MQLPEIVEVKGMKVLTTKQIAEAYGVKPDIIGYNFRYNKSRYSAGKHYIMLEGKELKKLKMTNIEIQRSLPRINRLYLWTEKGALLHAKSLNTDKAWEVYDYLVDFYFRAREEKQGTTKNEVVPTSTTTEKIKEDDSLPIMEETIAVFQNLIAFANTNGIQVKLKPLQSHNSILSNRRLAVREGMSFEKVTYEIAYELAHYCIHHNEGDLINSPLAKDYNGQAERAACMIVHMLDAKAQGY